MDPSDFNPFASGEDPFASYTSSTEEIKTLDKTDVNLSEDIQNENSSNTEMREVFVLVRQEGIDFNNQALEDLALGVDATVQSIIPSPPNQSSPDIQNHTSSAEQSVEPTDESTEGEPPSSLELDPTFNQNEANSPASTIPIQTIGINPSLVQELAMNHLVREEKHDQQLLKSDQQLLKSDQQLAVKQVDQIEEKATYEKFSKEVFVAIEHKNGDIDIVPYDPTNKLHQAKHKLGELVWKKGEEYAVASDAMKNKIEHTKGKIRHVGHNGVKTEIAKNKVRKLTDSEASEFKGLVSGYHQWHSTQQALNQQSTRTQTDVDQGSSLRQNTVTSLAEKVHVHSNDRQQSSQKMVVTQWQQILKSRLNEVREGAIQLANQRLNMTKRKAIQIQQQHSEEESALLRKKIKMQQLNDDTIAFQRNVQAREICERASSGSADVHEAIEKLNDLVPDRLKIGESNREALFDILIENAGPLEGRQNNEIIIKTPQTLLERAQNGEEPFASMNVLVEWSNIVEYLGLK